jgi:hypothetical protein
MYHHHRRITHRGSAFVARYFMRGRRCVALNDQHQRSGAAYIMAVCGSGRQPRER